MQRERPWVATGARSVLFVASVQDTDMLPMYDGSDVDRTLEVEIMAHRSPPVSVQVCT